MKKSGNILIVDDNRGVLTALQLLLKPYFDKITVLSSPVTLPATLREDTWQAVLLDMNFTSGINTGNEGLYWLHEIKKQYPALPVVLFTAYADIDLAVRGIKEGATDFIVKPWDNGKLVETLLNAAQNAPASGKKTATTPASTACSMYWGESPVMQQLHMLVEKVAAPDANILITGENGTGKELVARWLHAKSRRASGPFVEVNCAAIPSELIESELFGHERGAFTSAIKQRKGKFEQATGGTLFMDEIGDMSLAAQAKVLRALQENKICRVGSDKDIDVDVRVIAATNKNLREEIAKGNFREDLYHRLSVIVIRVPPLRERSSDVPELTQHFVDEISSLYGIPPKPIDSDAMEALSAMRWSGNVRELRNVIERLIILSGDTITIDDVHKYCQSQRRPHKTENGISRRFRFPLITSDESGSEEPTGKITTVRATPQGGLRCAGRRSAPTRHACGTPT